MKPNNTKKLKIGLAILLFLCLLDMPYGYYIFVRYCAMIGFGLLAYASSLKKGEKQFVTIYIVLLVLFQPLIKIPLGRTLWNIVDVVVGVWLVLDVIGMRIKLENK